MRLGFKEPEEIFQLIPVLNKYNITEVTVHARIGKQLYKGSVNHNIFEKVIQQSTIPVGYNGDIFTKNDFTNLTNNISRISFLMLGRGLLVDPFLPAHIKSIDIPNPEDQKEIIRKFIDDLYYERRKQHNDGLQTLGNMKEYWWYLSCSFDNPHKVFSLIKKKKNFEEYEDAVNRIFNDYNWLGQEADLFRKEQTMK
jgi:tRNA-dihydrouridine synthase